MQHIKSHASCRKQGDCSDWLMGSPCKCDTCRAQAAADREWRAKEKADAERRTAIQADLNEARARQAADRAAATAAAAEAARADAAALNAAAQRAAAAQERQACPFGLCRNIPFVKRCEVFLGLARITLIAFQWTACEEGIMTNGLCRQRRLPRPSRGMRPSSAGRFKWLRRRLSGSGQLPAARARLPAQLKLPGRALSR